MQACSDDLLCVVWIAINGTCSALQVGGVKIPHVFGLLSRQGSLWIEAVVLQQEILRQAAFLGQVVVVRAPATKPVACPEGLRW